MTNKKVLVVTDNEELLNRFVDLTQKKGLHQNPKYEFHYAYSSNNISFCDKYKTDVWIRPITIKDAVDSLIDNYNLIFSLHCKQMFPEKLVKRVKCINIHPGLNPYNRGWFPQVFSIINNFPCGATIHEIDEKLDHGPIICQKEINLEKYDTSLTAYNKILDIEMELLSANFEKILLGNYETFLPTNEGNINLKKDFTALCKIDVASVGTFLEHINILRALTHGAYNNAYFIDEAGDKIFLRLELIKK